MERNRDMAPFSSEGKTKMRSIIATETDIPGVFHIPTPHNATSTPVNEAIIKAVIERIDWKAIKAKN